jgi:type II secretory pathway component GspD/PulD (secretin)
MAEQAGLNIVLSADIGTGDEREPLVTLSVRNEPFEQALSMAVQSVGLSYKFIGDRSILVGTRERLRTEVGERSYIIPLNNVRAEKIVRSFAAFGGDVSAIEGQNALMVYANPETYADIIARIEELDKPQMQIEIRARLIEISINDTKKLGIDWSRINQLTTILAENPVNYDGIGLPWNYSEETGRMPHGGLHDFGQLPNSQYFQRIDGFRNVGHYSRQLTAWDITLDWLLENNAAKLLTDARITAMNGEEAVFWVGEVIPFVVVDSDRNVQVEREETGIKLSIRPTINKDGQITASIEPEVSSVVDLVGGFVPRTKMRTLKTTVSVPNGQKIYAGGLLSSNLVTTTNKVPFLGDIPFIGGLFRHNYTAIQNTDLVIEITPRIINLAEEQFDYEIDSRLGNELIRRKINEEANEEA